MKSLLLRFINQISLHIKLLNLILDLLREITSGNKNALNPEYVYRIASKYLPPLII